MCRAIGYKIQELLLNFGQVSKFVNEEEEAKRRGLQSVEWEWHHLLTANIERNYEPSLLGPAAESQKIHVKLPKVEVRKFDGDPLDFRRLWSTFSTKIDASEGLSEMSKLSYLKELLTPKVHYLIVGLRLAWKAASRVKLWAPMLQKSPIFRKFVVHILSTYTTSMSPWFGMFRL